MISRARGSLSVVGVGPGGCRWLTPSARSVLSSATHGFGYQLYVHRARSCITNPDLKWLASDNREEADRARQAVRAAESGGNVVMVSGGDPGIFGMAATVVGELDALNLSDVRNFDVVIEPGISSFQVAAAHFGAPLGGDFCILSLSTNRKPWAVIERRLSAAAEAGFGLALYNMASRSRREPVVRTLDLLREACGAQRIVGVVRDFDGPRFSSYRCYLEDLNPAVMDMRTILIVGGSDAQAVGKSYIVAGRGRDQDSDVSGRKDNNFNHSPTVT